MFRKSTHHGAPARKAVVAAFATALMLGGALLSTPASAAKDKPQAAKAEGNSKAFTDAYAPFQAIVNNPAGDAAAAKAMVPTIQAAIQNDTDKNTFGMALIALGGKLKDDPLEKQGIQLVLDSGKADPSKVGLFHFFLGKFAYDAKDFPGARTEFQAALQAGYTDNDPRPAIAETYFSAGQIPQGLDYLSGVIKQEQAAGRKAPDAWLLRGLQMAYNAKLAPQAADYAVMLVKTDPTQKNWMSALQVIGAVNAFDAQADLDVLRLMRLTGAMTQHGEYVEYVQSADPRRSAGEVLEVLDEGVKAGVLTTSDPVYTEAKASATPRLATDRKDLPSLVADAKTAAKGTTAQGAGDAAYSVGDYAQAAEMYKLALDKGVTDRDLTLTRLGIAEVRAGQVDQAKATFQQVGGQRAVIAKMWLAYADTKGAAPAA